MRDSSHQYVVLPEKCRVKYRNRPLKNQAITHPDKGRTPGVYFICMKNASMHAPACRSSSPNAYLFLSGWRTKTL
ncbi:hypothetical protein EX352_24650 [Klebsiella pneumoniae]|nr:hypothetical protein EX352_24650 [Klebsiella pneumoniae]QBH08558.1 hypothetical protein EYB55_14710 [Klebsiella pneumoniae]